MADKKISQLSAASTPLAGTEVLPIVQSGSTVKVASDDLTVKNVRSNATTGILQIAGPATAATRTMTVPDANFTVARTDAANSFTSDQTLADGNLVIGTAAKGIDFSANTHAAGMTSELLNWYEEGTWTPAYAPATGAFGSVTYDTAVTGGKYTRIGNMVHVQGSIRTDAITVGTASGQVYITGLPFAAASNTNGQDGWSTLTIGQATAWLGDVPSVGSIVAGQSRFELQYRSAANGATIDLAVTDMDTGADKNLMRFSATYIAA